MELTVEEVRSLYSDPDSITESGIQLRRIDYKGTRNYYSLVDGEVDWMYTSVTSFIKAVLPTSSHLMAWMATKSKEEQESILRSSSAYGTLMDVLFNTLLTNGEVTDIYSKVASVINRESLFSADINKWVDRLKRDCLAFCQWVEDYEVKPILVSCPLASKEIDIAGTLDLYCEMNDRMPTKKIQPKRIKAIVDYKAKIGDMSEEHSRESFYSSECLQLYIYKTLLDHNFPTLKTEGYFNFSPKNWRTSPNYNLKNWTDSKELSRHEANFRLYHEIYSNNIKGETERTILKVNDKITLDGWRDEYAICPLVDSVYAKQEVNS